MVETYESLFSQAFLRAVFDIEFKAFRDSTEELSLIERLSDWSKKTHQKETSSEAAFTNVFFRINLGLPSEWERERARGLHAPPEIPRVRRWREWWYRRG